MPDSLPQIESTTEPTKANWPKTPGGTIDWEIVFEHPETGLIAGVARAETPAALREAALTIVHAIYTRKNDGEESARLSTELIELVADDMTPEQFRSIANAIARTFRDIKELRKTKAADYEREQTEKAIEDAKAAKASKQIKKSGPNEAERRKATLTQLSIKQALERKKRQKAMALGGFAGLGGLAAIAAGMYFCLLTPALPPRADQILVQQMKSAIAGAGKKVHVYGGSLMTRRYLGDVSVTAEQVPEDACVTLGVNLANTGNLSVNGEILGYAGRIEAEALCANATQPIRVTWMPNM